MFAIRRCIKCSRLGRLVLFTVISPDKLSPRNRCTALPTCL